MKQNLLQFRLLLNCLIKRRRARILRIDKRDVFSLDKKYFSVQVEAENYYKITLLNCSGFKQKGTSFLVPSSYAGKTIQVQVKGFRSVDWKDIKFRKKHWIPLLDFNAERKQYYNLEWQLPAQFAAPVYNESLELKPFSEPNLYSESLCVNHGDFEFKQDYSLADKNTTN